MKEEQLSAEESLQLINRMIFEARGYFHESGVSALIYGFTVVVCSVLTYLDDTTVLRLPFQPFFIMVPVFVLQVWMHFREEKNKKAKTFTDDAIDFLWMGFFLSVIISLTGFLAGAGYIVITIILFLAGFSAFVTGMIAKFRYHIISGCICLIMAAISFFIQQSMIYFLLAAAATIFWIIPGFMLRIHFRKTSV